jgi:hypothetical protein
MRLALGFGGIAALSAVATALVAPSPSPALTASSTAIDVAVPQPSVIHVTRIVHLQPGQTAPPQALVSQMPAPSPRTVIITTRQSGAPKP